MAAHAGCWAVLFSILTQHAPHSLAGLPQPGPLRARAHRWPRCPSVDATEYWPMLLNAIDKITRNPLLLFLLFGLFLLRAPLLAGSSTQPACSRQSRSGLWARTPTNLWRSCTFGTPRAQQTPDMTELFGDVGILVGSQEFQIIAKAQI
jgi:hypothetical protein